MGALVFGNYFLSSDASILNGQIIILRSNATKDQRNANIRTRPTTIDPAINAINSRNPRAIPGTRNIRAKITRIIMTVENKHPSVDSLASKY